VDLSIRDDERDIESDLAGSKAQRRFVDLVVDSIPLYPLVRAQGFDCISAIWLDTGSTSASADAVRRLLGESPPDAPDDRVAVYVCAECRDLGCGALTVRVHRGADSVVWDEWSYQNNYDGEITPVDGLPAGSFDREQYDRVLESVLDRFSSS
jgi:hypothetical protein